MPFGLSLSKCRGGLTRMDNVFWQKALLQISGIQNPTSTLRWTRNCLKIFFLAICQCFINPKKNCHPVKESGLEKELGQWVGMFFCLFSRIRNIDKMNKIQKQKKKIKEKYKSCGCNLPINLVYTPTRLFHSPILFIHFHPNPICLSLSQKGPVGCH